MRWLPYCWLKLSPDMTAKEKDAYFSSSHPSWLHSRFIRWNIQKKREAINLPPTGSGNSRLAKWKRPQTLKKFTPLAITCWLAEYKLGCVKIRTMYEVWNIVCKNEVCVLPMFILTILHSSVRLCFNICPKASLAHEIYSCVFWRQWIGCHDIRIHGHGIAQQFLPRRVSKAISPRWNPKGILL